MNALDGFVVLQDIILSNPEKIENSFKFKIWFKWKIKELQILRLFIGDEVYIKKWGFKMRFLLFFMAMMGIGYCADSLKVIRKVIIE
jgi:hypothetical protein